MKEHTTNEGYQVFQALEHVGYTLHGHGFGPSLTDVREIVELENPGTVVVQDKLEWDPPFNDFREQRARFTNTEELRDRSDVFKVIIKKDAHNRQEYNRQAAEQVGAHGWIVYYHPKLVAHTAGYIRPEHMVRTYHSVDSSKVPPFTERTMETILSGAVSPAYPLRLRIRNNLQNSPGIFYLQHPGYHRNGTDTDKYLTTLSRFKVAICTASMYGYALRKIVEATACGCRVLTDLPSDEVLPEIDGNLFRIRPDTSAYHVEIYVRQLAREYDAAKQEHYADLAKKWYDFKHVGQRLADDIETLRRNY